LFKLQVDDTVKHKIGTDRIITSQYEPRSQILKKFSYYSKRPIYMHAYKLVLIT